MSTRFGTCVGHSATSIIVLETLLESSNIAWYVSHFKSLILLLVTFIWFFMSTRFGTCVGHSANSIVLETQLVPSNIAWHVKSHTNYRFSEVHVLHLLPNESSKIIPLHDIFFELYAFIILTSTLVLGINYFVIITRALHPIPVRKRSSSSCYMIETYNTRHRFPCYWTSTIFYRA